MATDDDGSRRRDVVEALLRTVRRQLRRTRDLERTCERATDELLLLEQALATIARSGSAEGITIPVAPKPRRERREVSWFASKVILSVRGPSSFVVGDVKHHVRLTRLQLELVSILAATTRESEDALVGFKKVDTIVNALHTKYGRARATGHSVVVAIARLREALGSVYEDLIERRPKSGYRLRVLPA